MLFRRDLVIFALSSVLCGPQAQALIIGGTLLDETGATLIESQIGLGELDFVNIFSGGTNASATSWHAAVDDTWPSVSIYSIMDPSTQLRYLIGGYSTVSWAGSGYVHDPTAFIFNLTSSTVRPLNPNMPYAGFSVYRDPSYFATYGGGHDIYGGSLSVGNGGYAYEGYSYGTPFTSRDACAAWHGSARSSDSPSASARRLNSRWERKRRATVATGQSARYADNTRIDTP